MTPDYNKLWDELKKKQDSATSAYYQTQRDAIKASANDQRRSAEISHRQSMKSLPAQIARLGLKGTGAAESSLIQANNAYEELLNSIRQDELTNEQNLYTAAAAATKKSGNTKKDSPTKDAGSVPLTYGLGKDIVQSPLGPELYSVDRDSKGNITKWTPVVDENGNRVTTQESINAAALLHDPNTAYASLLQDMYKQGKISRETYIERLKGLGMSVSE